MPNSWVTKSDGTEIRLAHPTNRAGMADGEKERSYDLINDSRFADADKARVALALKELLQEDLTFRQRTRDLPDDDPDKTTDPGRENLFWEGNGAKKELVSRSTIIQRFEWDGQGWAHELRNARRS